MTFLPLAVVILQLAMSVTANTVQCPVTMADGPCNMAVFPTNAGCSPGYSCDYTGTYCCPVVDYSNPANVLGPAINGACPIGYVIVIIPGGSMDGDCVSLQSAPGVCSASVQGGRCPNGNGCSDSFECFGLAEVCCPKQKTVSCAPTLSNGPCILEAFPANNGCSVGYSCDTANNYCCPAVDYNNPSNILGPAVNGKCPQGYVLVMIPGGTAGGDCVTLMSVPGVCNEAVAGGPCPNGIGCTAGFDCFRPAEYCCPKEKPVQCAPTMSNGPCVPEFFPANGGCSVGYSCDFTNNYCCPAVDYITPGNIIGPAIGGLCPIGYVMVMVPGGAPEGDCVSLMTVPGVCADAVMGGPCPGGFGCTAGFECYRLADVCCPS